MDFQFYMPHFIYQNTDFFFLCWHIPCSKTYPWSGNRRKNMSLACLACRSVESPSHSFRSYSVSSSDNEGRCSAIANCITRKLSHPPPRANSSFASSSSKVTPQPTNPGNDNMTGPPRLVRSRAVRRDLVRDWNFEGVVTER
ncbi:PYRD [Salix purpurea]|uniref:PYRD n=2 Tax=Salix purpurea TaxID=77065 RepID=A0A9Q0ZS59_SALPP|nr:PYRD [Salix purpurea]